MPIIGDDIKSQVGATISHRVLTSLFRERGVHLDRTMQLNVGGNSDFRNMLERERLESKKISKTNAVTSMLDYDLGEGNVHVGPSDYVPWLTDRKWAYIRMEGTAFGDVPLNLELKLEVWDSPNSAGIVIDAVRLAKLALNNGISGALEAPSSYLMKSPPVQIVDDEAHENTETFIKQYGLKAEKKAKAAAKVVATSRAVRGAARLWWPFAAAPRGSGSRAARCRRPRSPISRWVVSQNGLFFEWPQRQSTTELPGGSSNGTPSASTIVIGPGDLERPVRAHLDRDVAHGPTLAAIAAGARIARTMALRICFVTPFSWSQPHDVNEHVRGAAAALRRRGHTVTVVAPSSRAADLLEGRRALQRGVDRRRRRDRRRGADVADRASRAADGRPRQPRGHAGARRVRRRARLRAGLLEPLVGRAARGGDDDGGDVLLHRAHRRPAAQEPAREAARPRRRAARHLRRGDRARVRAVPGRLRDDPARRRLVALSRPRRSGR